MTGIEPATGGLLDHCSTDWATRPSDFSLVTLHAADGEKDIEKVKMGPSGNWTRDLSYPKRESYH